MKKGITAILAFCLIISGITVHAADKGEGDADYTVQAAKVLTDGIEAGELDLRFYGQTPNIPYIGIIEYSQYMKHPQMTLQKSDDAFVIENETGADLVFDPENGTITVSDWNQFFDYPLPQEDEAKGWKDTATRFIRIRDVEFEKEAAPVTLDFTKYGIQVYADDSDIYLPVSTLSNIMTDIATNHIIYNGENLYVQRMSLDGSTPEGMYKTERLKAELQGEKRPEDIAKQSYADLCFNIDYFFGHPGKAPLDKAVAGMGLEDALMSLGKKGESLIAKLKSTKLIDYISAINEVLMVYLGDGHTLFTGSGPLMEANMDSLSTMDLLKFGMDTAGGVMNSSIYLQQTLNETISLQRMQYWGNDNYRESGNTAIIRLDSFMPDEKAWDLYYKGEGDFPQDSLGIVLTGLKRASENPDIENVIFDLSCNSGGSPDVMMAILEVATGQNQLYGIHKLTGRRMTFTFEADTNFDGVYDEKDKEKRYDFRYGVLVTRHAFSCGNLFPIIIREAGAVLIGEPSGGGSCCVQVGTDAEGFQYMMSSAQWQLTDSSGTDVEGGCVIDVPIKAKTNKSLDSILGLVGFDGGIPDYGKYFDDAYLSKLMNEYFESGAEELAA